MRGVSTLRAKGTCDRPVALATMNTIERIFAPRRDFDRDGNFEETSTDLELLSC